LEEILANTWWRTLQLRNFINPDHTLSPWGIGLSNGLEKLTGYPDLFDSLYVGLELIRSKFLNHEDFSVKYTGGPMHGTGIIYTFVTDGRRGEETHSLRLSCRMLDLVDENSISMGRTSK
jgi:hypothetical protein